MAAPELDDELVRYHRPLFVDPALQDRLRAAGYVALSDPVLDADDVGRLRAVALEFLDRVEEPTGDLFLTVGRVRDPALRAEISRRTAELVLPRLRPFFVEDAEISGSALQVKPPSPSSALNCHQDSSLVDERTALGVYAWIALDDTDERNGGLQVLPGSHRFGNWQRTLNVPWQLAPYGEAMARRSVPLSVAAGCAVFFDAATVHSSPPNRGSRVRLATNAFVAHRGTALLHFFQDDRTTPGTVEVYEIDLSFFQDEDIMARPGVNYRFLGEWPHHRVEWSDEEFEALCDRAIAEAGGPS